MYRKRGQSFVKDYPHSIALWSEGEFLSATLLAGHEVQVDGERKQVVRIHNLAGDDFYVLRPKLCHVYAASVEHSGAVRFELCPAERREDGSLYSVEQRRVGLGVKLCILENPHCSVYVAEYLVDYNRRLVKKALDRMPWYLRGSNQTVVN